MSQEQSIKIPIKMPLVILDTNVLVAALCRRENSPSYKILKSIQQGKVPIALTQKLYLEYESVLNREKILQLIDATPDEVRIVVTIQLS